MTTSLLLLADTHVPARARDLPAAVWALVEAADLVVHAGDWVVPDLLDALTARAPAVLGCWGNNDGPELRDRLPEVARADVDGVRLAVVHETGPSTGREARLDARHHDVDLLVFGHSHIPWDTMTPAGMRVVNPGSPTDRRRQPWATCATARVDRAADGSPTVALTWHRVGPGPLGEHPVSAPGPGLSGPVRVRPSGR